MEDIKKNATSTGEPVEGQAPTPGTDTKGPASSAPTQTADKTASATGTLPAGYLSNGSMVDTDGALLPEYIGKYAQSMAGKLKPLKASAFHTAFLKEAKEARKKKVAYGVKKNCVLGMVTQAKKLVSRKKDPAPAILLEMITEATATVRDPGTFEALYMHLDAVYSYLLSD